MIQVQNMNMVFKTELHDIQKGKNVMPQLDLIMQ